MNIIQAILNFFRVEKANTPKVTVQELMSADSARFAYRLWYRGNAFELNQFYKNVDSTGQMFWGSVPMVGREIRKAHTGLPKIIVDTLAKITTGDLNDIDFDDKKQEELWLKIAEANDFPALLKKATKDALFIGDGAFKFSLDEKVSKEVPVIEWYPGDRVEVETYRGRVRELIFKTPFTQNSKQYFLIEHYGYGYIKYEIVNDQGKKERMTDFPNYSHLIDVEFVNTVMLAVPFMITESENEEKRGQSIFEGKIDNFDALDEAYSQWLQSMRETRPVKYIPEMLCNRDPENGGILQPSAFDNQFIAVADDMRENGKNEITVEQPTFPADEYNLTYITNLDLCLQGLISPSTLGIDVKKLDNAESQREKEKTTLYTRADIIEALSEVIKDVVRVAIYMLDIHNKRSLSEIEIDVTFGEYANPSFEAVVETMSNPNTPMSIEAKVDEMWGDSKDDEWKAEEVARIKAEQGVIQMGEPTIADPLEITGGDE